MLRLARHLGEAGHTVALGLRSGAGAPPRLVELLLSLERIAHKSPGEHGADRVAGAALEAALGPPAQGAPDLVLDLTGGAAMGPGRTGFRLLYDGDPREEAAVAAVLDGRAPQLGIESSAAPGRPGMMRPAIEHPHVLAFALDQLGARAVSLLLRAVDRHARGVPQEAGEPVPPPRLPRLLGPSAFAWKLATRLDALSRRPPHWYVGWRRCGEAERLTELGAIPAEGWRQVPDDGRRFYADPVIFAHRGQTVLFVEELPHITGKGVLGYMPIGPDGPEPPARPVLERPYHLSYPFVFEHEGGLFMIPESFEQRRIELYRAVAFPDRWELEAVLIDDIAASDATVVTHEGRLYLFANVSGEEASTWDALHVFTADRLTGPWVPLPGCPVIADALGARPAGAFYRRAGTLYRPAMDCRTGYGVGLALARVDRLDPDGFAQTIEAVIAPGGAWPGTALHTLNYAEGIEVVDGCRPRGN